VASFLKSLTNFGDAMARVDLADAALAYERARKQSPLERLLKGDATSSTLSTNDSRQSEDSSSRWSLTDASVQTASKVTLKGGAVTEVTNKKPEGHRPLLRSSTKDWKGKNELKEKYQAAEALAANQEAALPHLAPPPLPEATPESSKPQLRPRRNSNSPHGSNHTPSNSTSSSLRTRSGSESLRYVGQMTINDYERAEQKRLDRLLYPNIGELEDEYITRIFRSHEHLRIVTDASSADRWWRLEGALRPQTAELKKEYLQRMSEFHTARDMEEAEESGTAMPLLSKEQQRDRDEQRWEASEGRMRPFAGETREEYLKRMIRPWVDREGYPELSQEVITVKVTAGRRWEKYCG
jgi:hypothetical protein